MLHSLDNLRCFLAAARLHNFARAAKLNALTPAAFGQRIKQLEEQLGKPLFVRTTRSIQLTEAGSALVPWAQQTLDAADACVRAVSGEPGAPEVELTLGTRHELGMSWLLPQLDGLLAVRSGLRIHMYFGSGPDLLLKTRSLDIDCAITSSRFQDARLDAIRLHREDYVLVAAATLLRRLPLHAPEHAEQHTLLDISADLPLFRYWKDAPHGGERLRFQRIDYLGTIGAIRVRALKGAGVAALPEYLVHHDLARGRLERVFPKVRLLSDYFRLVFRANDPRRALFESLAAKLLEAPLR
ncbi:MAG TPA: LysR family transcriptional regulator [Polyangiaceae bacterium]|nr:LysR family transcriptional regulator [Polyangiaceae bacterium]